MKENEIVFYVNNFNYLKTSADCDVNFVPPILRRRMSKLDKCVISVLNSVFSDNIENIVFSSRYGEVERLLKIIGQYIENNEVSPNVFSGSVHNFLLGFYLLNTKKSVPYTALAACENSIFAGMLSSVISNYSNNIFCYGDIEGDDFVSMAINISKTPYPESQKYILKSVLNNDMQDNFEDFINLFTGKKQTISTALFLIERDGYYE